MSFDFSEWKCRASSGGKLMTKVAYEFSEDQLLTYKDLHQKYLNQVPLSKTNTNKYLSLAKKITGNPELSQTAKTMLEDSYKEHVFGRYHRVESKYLTKGLLKEDEGISLYCEVTRQFDVKYEGPELFSEYFKGTPDIINNIVKDIKNSWTFKTFPLTSEKLPNKDYWWQMQWYMSLTELDRAQVIYCLLSQTTELIDDELNRLNWKHKIFGIDKEVVVDNPKHIEIIVETVQNMIVTEEDLINFCRGSRFHIELEWFDNFKEIIKEHRVKIFDVEYNEDAIEKAEKQVQNARKYLNGINLRLAAPLLSKNLEYVE